MKSRFHKPAAGWLKVIFVLIWLPSAQGHSLWDGDNGVLVPRTTNNNQLKQSPCGGAIGGSAPTKMTPPPVTLSANQSVALHWKETIDHEGYYLIQFSTGNETQWTTLANIPDNQSGAGTHFFSAPVVMPNYTCDQCILRLVQVMVAGGNETYYYSCADIRTVGGTGSAPVPDSGSSHIDQPSTSGIDCGHP